MEMSRCGERIEGTNMCGLNIRVMFRCRVFLVVLQGIRSEELRSDVGHFVLPAIDPVLEYIGVNQMRCEPNLR